MSDDRRADQQQPRSVLAIFQRLSLGSWLVAITLVALAVQLLLTWNAGFSLKDAAEAATSIGSFLVLIGVFIAVSALQHAAKSLDYTATTVDQAKQNLGLTEQALAETKEAVNLTRENLDLAKQSLVETKEAVDLSRANLDLATQSLVETKNAVDLTRANLDLATQSLEETKKAVGHTQENLNLTAASLRLAERTANRNIDAARGWLISRRRITSHIDYLLFSSTDLMNEIRSETSDGISVQDAAKSLIAVIGPLRRTRDALLGYSENHGLLLSFGISEAHWRSAAKKGEFSTYMDTWEMAPQVLPTCYLYHQAGWLFNGSTGAVKLNAKTLSNSMSKIISLVDYLDARSGMMQSFLELDALTVPDKIAYVRPASDNGLAMFSALSEAVKDAYVHLAVLRACLETEWVLAFKNHDFSDEQSVEDEIARLLRLSDSKSFVFANNNDATLNCEPDSIAGYRFGHALAHLNKSGVFSSATQSSETFANSSGVEKNDPNMPRENARVKLPPRVRELFGSAGPRETAVPSFIGEE